jgi:hypothetical protein
MEQQAQMVDELYWRTKDGYFIKLNRIPSKEFAELNHSLVGLPVLYAVWPTPEVK